MAWSGGGGAGARPSPGRNSAPPPFSTPKWNYTLYRGLWWLWAAIPPLTPEPSLPPLILKSLATPLCTQCTWPRSYPPQKFNWRPVRQISDLLKFLIVQVNRWVINKSTSLFNSISLIDYSWAYFYTGHSPVFCALRTISILTSVIHKSTSLYMFWSPQLFTKVPHYTVMVINLFYKLQIATCACYTDRITPSHCTQRIRVQRSIILCHVRVSPPCILGNLEHGDALVCSKIYVLKYTECQPLVQ